MTISNYEDFAKELIERYNVPEQIAYDISCDYSLADMKVIKQFLNRSEGLLEMPYKRYGKRIVT